MSERTQLKPERPQAKEPLWTREFIVLTAMNFGIALPFYLLMVIITDFCVKSYDVDYATGALSVSAFVITALLARILLGGKIDKWGIRHSLAIGLGICFAACACYMVPMPFWLLVAIRAVQGVGFALASGSAASAAALAAPASRRSEGIGYFSMMQALATGVGPFVAVFLQQVTGDYMAVFATNAVVSGLAFASVLLVKSKAQAVKDSQAEEGKARIEAQTPSGRRTARLFHTTVLLFTPTIFLVYLGYAGVVSYVVPYANEAGLSEAAALYFVLYALAILATRPSVGRHVDKHGEHPLIYVTLGSVAVGLFVLSISTNAPLLLFSAVLIGFGVGATQSIIQAVIARDIPPHELGLANSTFFMSMDLGAGVGPVIIGGVVPAIGFSACYGVLAAFAIVSIVLYLVLGVGARRRLQDR